MRTCRLLRRFAVVLAVVPVLSCAWVPAAAGHEVVVATTPASNARLDAAPLGVSVMLTGPVDGSTARLTVVDGAGRSVVRGDPMAVADGRTVAVALVPDTGAGSYLVSFAAIGPDAHPIQWTFAFVVGDGPLLAPGGGPSTGADPLTASASAVLTWLTYVGLVMAAGLVLLRVVWAGRPVALPVRAVVIGGCAAIAVATVGALLLRGPQLTLAVPYERLLLLRIVAALLLAAFAAALFRRSAAGPGRAAPGLENAALISGLVILLSIAGTGHAAGDDLPLITMAAAMTHLGAVAAWVGGLVVVVVSGAALMDDPRLARRALLMTSRIGAVAVLLVVVSGALLALRNLGSPAELVTSEYGLRLLAKLAVVGALLAAAEASRRALRHRDSHPAGGSTLALHRVCGTVALEAALAAIVLVAATLLGSTAPPSAS